MGAFLGRGGQPRNKVPDSSTWVKGDSAQGIGLLEVVAKGMQPVLRGLQTHGFCTSEIANRHLTHRGFARSVQNDLNDSNMTLSTPPASPPTLSTAEGLAMLEGVALNQLASHNALAEARTLVSGDLEAVEALLAERAQEGAAPANHAAEHLISSGGKRVRSLALLLSAACFGEVRSDAVKLATVAEMIHGATLLHDDVIDEGDERRGQPTARRVYRNSISVLSGDLLLTHALALTSEVGGQYLPGLIETLRRLVDGEVIQLRGRSALDLREETYFSILSGKTASLFGWAAATGGQIGGASRSQQAGLRKFGEALGTAFQLVDDCLDYEGESTLTGKALFADLAEGKITLPLATCAQWKPELTATIAKAREGDAEALSAVSAAVVASGACAHVRKRAEAFTDEACAALACLPPSPHRSLLQGVARAMTGRNH